MSNPERDLEICNLYDQGIKRGKRSEVIKSLAERFDLSTTRIGRIIAKANAGGEDEEAVSDDDAEIDHRVKVRKLSKGEGAYARQWHEAEERMRESRPERLRKRAEG